MSSIEKLPVLFKESLPFFTALGDPVRQQLVMLMIDGSHKSVRELAEATDVQRPTVSHHLKILKEAGIVDERKEGRERFYYPKHGKYFDTIKELVDTVDGLIKEKHT